MFGMGATEILVILVVALLFLGPDKLPEAAKQISKGIRDLRKQTRELSTTIENDTELGGAIKDLKSALRGDEPRRPPVRTAPPTPVTAPPEAPKLAEAEPSSEGADLIRPAANTVAKGSAEPEPAPVPVADSTTAQG
jgi:sec-independent protein translocase protein TatB